MAVAGYESYRSPPLPHDLDPSSLNFPERPIRPLPKRRIRARLSEEQQDSIVYPPVPPSSSPLFGSPLSQNDRSTNPGYYPKFALKEEPNQDLAYVRGAPFCSPGESEEDEKERNGPRNRSSWPGGLNKGPRQKQLPSHSAASSADGYESFENTNNKKKRKIPTSGTSAAGVPVDIVGSNGQPNHTYAGNLALATSNAARGRNVKSAVRAPRERQPLAASASAANAYASDPPDSGMKPGMRAPGVPISDALAQHLAQPRAGQENSVIRVPTKATAQPNNFTFECKSNSSNIMGLAQRPATAPSSSRPGFAANATQGTQTGSGPVSSQQGYQDPQYAVGGPAAQEKKQKPRRSPAREYALAARQRRLQQEYNNLNQPPSKEDIWVCEFCEYESIFGVQPVALVRQYEVKDRRKRKEAEERRRLLEKAKAKGRKNKKGTKGNKNSAAANHPQDPQGQRYDSTYDTAPLQDPESPGDEFYEEGYDDDTLPPHPSEYAEEAYDTYSNAASAGAGEFSADAYANDRT